MPLLGVDLGATNIAAAVVSESGEIIRKASTPTLPKRTATEIIDDMAALMAGLLEEERLSAQDILAAGIGVPGLVHSIRGLVHESSNLFWHQVPLRDLLQERLDLPFHITNDANCAALAELKWGVFQGKKSALLITIGSGIGGGIIFDGKLYIGAHGAAGEFGHMQFNQGGEPCACGKRGCFERYASASALARIAPPGLSTTKEVIDAAKSGSPEALEAFHEYIENLALGIVSLIIAFDPEIIALGGGVSEAGEFLIEAVREKVQDSLPFVGFFNTEITLATRGNEAGILGAALFAQQSENELAH